MLVVIYSITVIKTSYYLLSYYHMPWLYMIISTLSTPTRLISSLFLCELTEVKWVPLSTEEWHSQFPNESDLMADSNAAPLCLLLLVHSTCQGLINSELHFQIFLGYSHPWRHPTLEIIFLLLTHHINRLSSISLIIF